MHPRGSLLLAPLQRRAIDGEARCGVLESGGCRQQPLRPGAKIGFSHLAIHPFQDRVAGCHTGQLAGKA
jgi:hypothetical protein